MTKKEMYAEIRELIGLLPKTTNFFNREECLKLLEVITHFDKNKFIEIPTDWTLIPTDELLPKLKWLWEAQKTVSTHPTKKNLKKIRDHLISMGLAGMTPPYYPIKLQRIIELLGADLNLVNNIKEIELKDKTLTILFK